MPAGRDVLVLRSELANVVDHFSCSSGRRGRRAKRSAPYAQRRNLGVADVRRFRARDKDVWPC
eukprot:14165098-Alexandrium_andersonii.AAC.1